MENQIDYGQQVLDFAEKLKLPLMVRIKLEERCRELPWEVLKKKIIQLTDVRYAEEMQRQLSVELASYNQDDGIADLAVMLAAALHTKELYEAWQLSEQIYWDTMGCFGRFIDETHRNTGEWKFDRAFWTWRQTACCLFRIGTLEFEYTVNERSKEQMVISVHIPSDSKLTLENLEYSYGAQHRFFIQNEHNVCYNGIPKEVVCHTWLLSPILLQFLKQDSGIRRFAEDYDILETDDDNSGCLEWLFEGKTDLLDLPENTTLQKAVKKFLLQGGNIGHAWGKLKKKCL